MIVIPMMIACQDEGAMRLLITISVLTKNSKLQLKFKPGQCKNSEVSKFRIVKLGDNGKFNVPTVCWSKESND